ncbi:hypothetical protein IWQ47_004563 [Aquimarina sp. EL_43]|uniref:DUF3078 domain-containing protein n=1 Tax=Aquimarina TaxID=290174 RepID=UPI00046F7166|nr:MULTISPECIES: DUF3078 domain-containing protein [Aquimarina]MBG6133103.1 hypothetical protein [Aquimarina sp. EL_35]MBG6153261.1 hypothetical protein [Aquimarina sp. EL_32]MBG6171470.1 hypothetical protein [Aquimarina sp. EL_43]
MSRFFLAIFLLLLVTKISGQEKEKTKYLDSIQVNLKRSLDSILKNTTNDLNIIVLKQKLKEITPKKQKKEHIGWKDKANFALLFNQSAFNYDWQGGGTSNIAGNVTLNYEFNYKKNSLTWDNKIIADYGLTFLRGEDFPRKTNDRIEFNTRLGQKIGQGFWNYSLFINFRSQFDKGYRFTKDPDTEETIRTEETHFFSPAFIQIGPGLLWKKSDNLHINIAPVTSRMIFVDKEFTNVADYVDGDYFGVDAGESSRFEFGGSLAAYSKYTLAKNITLEQLLNLYSNYIEDPANVDIDYTLNINLLVNKYITGSFVFQAIYDDNATSGFQIREVIGLGLKYKF